jgi:hypothetical protein
MAPLVQPTANGAIGGGHDQYLEPMVSVATNGDIIAIGAIGANSDPLAATGFSSGDNGTISVTSIETMATMLTRVTMMIHW